MRMFKKSLLLAALVTFMGTGVANATTLTFNLTSDHCTGGCLVGPSGGTITVNDNGERTELYDQSARALQLHERRF